jgi:hypothetical protein
LHPLAPVFAPWRLGTIGGVVQDREGPEHAMMQDPRLGMSTSHLSRRVD